MERLSRRTVLEQMVLAGAGLAVLPGVSWGQETGRELIPFEDIPENFFIRRPGDFKLPGQATVGIDLRNITPKVAPTDWFLVAHYNIPEIDAKDYRLTIDGLAGRPMTLTLDDLKRRPRVERTATFECGGNREQVMHRMVGNATWAGCSLRSLLEEARPAKEVLEAIFWGADRGKETIRAQEYEMEFARSMSLADALASDAILAYEIEGQPLPAVRGYPVRLLVPGWYGVSNVKWLDRIELSPRRYMGKFMGRDYVTIMGRKAGDRIEWTETSVTKMLVKSVTARVTRPTGGGTGRFVVQGAAWGDGTPIEKVDVQIDGGPWQPARLEANRHPYAWTFFTHEIDPLPAGSHTVASRATDRLGRTQPADLSLKKSNWENNAIWVRKIRV
jgi:DMSO/TMAO reductase YedYZ molybdopterin-dependent catalytic subunit